MSHSIFQSVLLSTSFVAVEPLVGASHTIFLLKRKYFFSVLGHTNAPPTYTLDTFRVPMRMSLMLSSSIPRILRYNVHRVPVLDLQRIVFRLCEGKNGADLLR